MTRQLIISLLLALLLCSPAQAGILKALTKPIKKTCRVVVNLWKLPEYILFSYGEAFWCWYHYENVCGH